MLARVVRRLGRAKTLQGVVIATTVEPADDPLAELCSRRGWPCFRGSQDDVLDRYYQAARHHRADTVVRITADCPLIEPAVVDRVVTAFLASPPPAQYAANILPRRTFPRGLDTEVFSFEVLERTWREDHNPAWREHVTEYVLRHPEWFRLEGVLHDSDLSHMRWTVDTPEDLALIRRVYEHFGHDRFSWVEAISLLEAHPDWVELNRHVQQKDVL
jgi:spore coat polysaccharide biosynthesis protein SpsF